MPHLLYREQGPPPAWFNPGCSACPRLSVFLDEIRARYPHYHAAPVAPFGDLDARLVIVGLAPGLHGANATGRPFTGDHAGILLYQTLHHFGFASAPFSHSREDGLALKGCRITNAVKCVPPANKPTPAETRQCNPFLKAELMALPPGSLVLALGLVAHGAVLTALGLKGRDYPFAHGACHSLAEGSRLLDSYHCSRYNTQTGRLTTRMFYEVFARARQLLEGGLEGDREDLSLPRQG